jgi:type III restriction enzyme
MPEVACHMKNQGLSFTISYSLSGNQKTYRPGFIVKVKDDQTEPLNLILEGSGESRKDKVAKVGHA